MSSFDENIKRIFGLSDEEFEKLELDGRVANLQADQVRLAEVNYVLGLVRSVLDDAEKFFGPVAKLFGQRFVDDVVDLTASMMPSGLVRLSPDEDSDVFQAFAFPVVIRGGGPDGVYILSEMTVDFVDGSLVEKWTPYLTLDGEKVTSVEQVYSISDRWNWPLEQS